MNIADNITPNYKKSRAISDTAFPIYPLNAYFGNSKNPAASVIVAHFARPI